MATISLDVTTTLDQNDGSDYQGLSLRDAILQANADSSNEYIINLPAGIYDLTIKNVLLPTTDSSADSDTLFRSRLTTGDLDITGNITIIGADPANTIINAETLTEPLPPVIDPDNPFPDDPVVPTETIGDRIFDVLSATTSGKPTDGSLVVQNVTITGGIISDENIETISNGGALNIESGAEATFINSIIAKSKVTAGQGGGINNDGTLTLDGSILDGNNSSDNAGGIYNRGTLTIRDSAIINNLADAAAPDIIEGGGGGVLNENGGTLIMVNTTVSGNRSASENDTNPDNIPNGPGDGGGGILSRGTTRIINSTIVNNFAQVGSGIYSETTTANTILYNTIVGNNSGSPDLDGFFDSRSAFNLVSNANGSILDASQGNIVGGATTPRIDILIGPLQDNGGPTPNHALLSGSLAINAGDNSMVDFPVFFPDSPALDQRGSERISDGTIDIGAYEVFVQGTTPITTPTNPIDTSTTGVNDTGTNSGSTSTTDSDDTSTTGVNDTLTNSGSTSTTDSDDTSTTGVNDTVTNSGSTSTTDSDDTSTTGVNDTLTNSGSTSTTNSDDTSTTGVNDTLTNSVLGISDGAVVLNQTSDNSDPLLNSPIFRFQNISVPGTYLYAGEEESQNIRSQFPNFQDEGFAFNVAQAPADDLIAMYRFQNSLVPGTYLFAAEEESISIREDFPNFVEEGIAFYAYGADADKGQDIYRFQSVNNPGTYLFAGEAEKNSILANFSSSFILEGVAFEVG